MGFPPEGGGAGPAPALWSGSGWTTSATGRRRPRTGGPGVRRGGKHPIAEGPATPPQGGVGCYRTQAQSSGERQGEWPGFMGTKKSFFILMTYWFLACPSPPTAKQWYGERMWKCGTGPELDSPRRIERHDCKKHPSGCHLSEREVPMR